MKFFRAVFLWWPRRKFRRVVAHKLAVLGENLRTLQKELQSEGFEVDSVLAMGEPATEIIKLARSAAVELIAMSTHGHRFISDLLYGSTADKVRHSVDIPVLLLKVKP